MRVFGSLLGCDVVPPVVRNRRFRRPYPLGDPADVLAVFLRHPQAHPYGIADVVQLWDVSRWWRHEDGVVGLLDLPGSTVPVVYAVSVGAETATLDLLAHLAPAWPDRLMLTGPVGLAERLFPWYDARFSHRYAKMHLARPELLPAVDDRVEVLGRADLGVLERLYDTDPSAGDFFHAGLLDTGLYLGLWDGPDLVATAGIHVIERMHGVAAIGNVAAHFAYRRRGLARAVVATLCHRLCEQVGVVGLNVRDQNAAARALYESLGFVRLVPYEEAELVRR